jgi:hypothetical protein
MTDLVAVMKAAAQTAEEHAVTLAFEPEGQQRRQLAGTGPTADRRGRIISGQGRDGPGQHLQ